MKTTAFAGHHFLLPLFMVLVDLLSYSGPNRLIHRFIFLALVFRKKLQLLGSARLSASVFLHTITNKTAVAL